MSAPALTRPKGDLHTETQLISMGPSHPATHGTVKIMLEIDGEEIVEMDVQIGYLHRGFEKECESGTWYQAIPYTDRLNYNSAILANLAFCMAVEKLLECQIPRRGQWVRTLAGELSHILGWIEQLGEVDTDDVAPMTSVVAMRLAWREDRVTDGDRAEAVLANAPLRALALPKNFCSGTLRIAGADHFLNGHVAELADAIAPFLARAFGSECRK